MLCETNIATARRVVGGGIMLGALAVLGGCQTWATAPADVDIEHVEKRFVERGCPPGRCATVEVDSLRFPGAPGLTERLQDELLGMGTGITDGESAVTAASWKAFAQTFFSEAKVARERAPELPGYQAVFKAEVYDRHADLTTVKLDSYLFTGGAHGMPLTQFMVIDERARRVVTLDDMLREGQTTAYRKALSRAHLRWLDTQRAEIDFTDSWPLSMNRNVAPLADEWRVGYNAYDIAPYSYGQPVLRIPAKALEGIVKPRYLER
ncbi:MULTISPECIES: RsiV family protein [Chromohalobacter]|uniref:RsiV family protein n=1 Tax=Chromohalobacter TaxID=42054 RepID=UPI001FB91CDF|nr:MULTISPECIES: RsiV family protein [Chromohalobacter]MCI0509279.1 RsiV family protein [Chromohalobacter sp.]MCI0593566.1 RsiV family protein [Chromohalobacter sp.]